MKTLKPLFVIILFLAVSASQAYAVTKEKKYKPLSKIVIVPLDGVTNTEIYNYKMLFWDCLGSYFVNVPMADDITIDKRQRLPKSCLNYNKTRYDANKVLKYLSAHAPKNTVVIGVTNKDISCRLHGRKDWGIFGLANKPGNACIVSTHRIREKSSNTYVVMVHEFLHSQGVPHCPDKECVMQDFKGKAKFEPFICDRCINIALGRKSGAPCKNTRICF